MIERNKQTETIKTKVDLFGQKKKALKGYFFSQIKNNKTIKKLNSLMGSEIFFPFVFTVRIHPVISAWKVS